MVKAKTYICVHCGRTCGTPTRFARQLLLDDDWVCNPGPHQDGPNCWRLIVHHGEGKGSRGIWVPCRDCGEQMGPLPPVDSFREYLAASLVVVREHSRGHKLTWATVRRAALVALFVLVAVRVSMYFAGVPAPSLVTLTGIYVWSFLAGLATSVVGWGWGSYQNRRRRARRGSRPRL